MDIPDKAIVTKGDKETQGFIISLDGVDSKLLPAFSFKRQKDKTVPLWSPVCSGSGAEYHEFEVVIEGDGDSDDDHGTIETTGVSTHCFTCEVEVLSVYWEQHVQSVAHRARCLIADVSLERARKMALNSPTFALDIPQTFDEYFCEQCFRPVAIADRITHVTSEEHSRSVMKEKLLNSLARLYENNDNFDSVYEDIFGRKENQNCGETSGGKDCEIQSGVNSNTHSAQKQRNRTYAIVYPNSGAKLKISLDNYHGFSALGDKTLCRVCRVVVDDKFDHEWDLEHRKKVEAAVKDKHCIRVMNNILNYCMLCNDIIENTEEHILCSETHKSSLRDALIEDDKTTISDDSYTKEVMSENFIENVTFNKEMYYCKVCQIYLLKSTLFEHVDKYAHASNMKQKPFNKKGVVNNYEKIKSNKTSITNTCNVCNTCHPGKKGLIRHFKTNEHRYNEWLSEKDSKPHYHMIKSSNPQELICKVCFEHINSTTHAVNDHINSDDHQTNYKKVLDDNYMRKIDEIEVHCELCQKTVYMFDAIDHVNKPMHKKKISNCQNANLSLVEIKKLRKENVDDHVPSDDDKIKEVLEKNRLYDTNYLQYRCSACNRYIKKTQILGHIVSKKHKRRLNNFVDYTCQSSLESVLQSNHIEDQSAEFYRCNVCQILVPKSLNILDHINSRVHKRYINTFGVSATEKKTVQEEIGPDETEEKNRIIESETRDIKEQIMCSDTYNSSHQDALIKDDKTTLAKDSYIEEIMSENFIENVEFNKENYFCQVCRMYFSKPALFEHVDSYKHNRNMRLKFVTKEGQVKEKVLPHYCDLCRVTAKGGKRGVTEHYKSKAHRYNEYLSEKDSKPHYHMLKSSNPAEVVCKICVERISGTTQAVNDHINSNDHQTKYMKVLDDNFMRKVNDTEVYCEVCNVTEYMFDVLEHANRKPHKNKNAIWRTVNLDAAQLKNIRQANVGEEISCDDTKIRQVLEENQVYDINPLQYRCKACNLHVKKIEILSHIASNQHQRRVRKILSLRKEDTINKIPATIKVENINEHAELNQTVDSNSNEHEKSSENSEKDEYYDANEEPCASSLLSILQSKQIKDQNAEFKIETVPDETEYMNTLTVSNSKDTTEHILCSDTNNSTLQDATIDNDITTIPEDSYIKDILSENYIKIVEFNKDLYYCIMCQVYIPKRTLFEHIDKWEHDSNMRLKFVTEEGAVKEKILSNYCDVCRLTITNGQKAVNQHYKSKEHRYNEWLSEKDIKLHYHVMKSSNPKFVVCKVCFEHISGTTYAVNEHINSNSHETKYYKILHDNFMRNINEIEVHCNLCNLTEYIFDVIDHVNRKSHRKKIVNRQTVNLDVVELQKLLQENVGEDVPCDDGKIKKVLKENRLSNIDHLQFRCNVCNRDVTKTEILGHIVSNKHKQRLENIVSLEIEDSAKKEPGTIEVEGVSELKQTVNSIKTAESSNNEKNKAGDDQNKTCASSLESILKSNHIENLSAGYYRCNVCQRLVTKSVNILTHINSRSHKSSFDKFFAIDMKENPAKEAPDATEDKNTTIECFKNTANASKITSVPTNKDCDLDFVKKLEVNWIKKKENNYYNCGVCDVAIQLGFEETHMESEKHANNLANIKRLSDQGVLKNEDVYQCTLCLKSVKIGFEESHVESLAHTINFDLNERLKFNQVFQIGKNYFCEVCLISVSRSDAEPHIETEEHKRNLQSEAVEEVKSACKSLNTMKEEGTKNPVDTRVKELGFKKEKPTKLHYLFEVTEDNEEDEMVTCMICYCGIPFDRVQRHVKKNEYHKILYQNLMDANTISRINHKRFCECCKEIMEIVDEYTHITSDKHRLNMAHMTRRMDEEERKELSLKLFQEDIAAIQKIKRQERYARIKQAKDSDDGENSIETIKLMFFVSSSFDIEKVSDEEESNNNNCFISAETNTTVVEIQNLKKETDDVINDENIKAELQDANEEVEETADYIKTIAHLFETTDIPKQLLCKLCHIAVGNRSDLLLEHVSGVKHVKNYESVLLQNNLKEVVDIISEKIQKYSCKACGIDISTSELFGHVNSDKHKLYLTVEPSTSGSINKEMKTDLEPERKKVQQSKVVSCDPTILAHEIYLMKFHNYNELYCKLCDYDYSYADLNKHVKSSTHQTRFNSLLIENDVKRVGVKLFCSLCRVILTEGEELEHIYADSHKAKGQTNAIKLKTNKSYTCTTCNIELVNNQDAIKLHNSSVRHSLMLSAKKGSKTNIISTIAKKDSKRSDAVEKNINRYFSEVCQVEVPNNLKNIKTHNDGGNHQNNLKIVEKRMQTKVAPTLTHTQKVKSQVQGKVAVPTGSKPALNTTKPNMPTTEDLGIENVVNKDGLCVVCKTYVPINPANIKQHINGITHIFNLNKRSSITGTSQNIENRANAAIHSMVQLGHCNLCNIKVPQNTSSILIHVDEKLHKQRLKDINNIPKLVESRAGGNNNLTGGSESYVNTLLKKGYCNLCKIKVPNNVLNINEHITGRTHSGNYVTHLMTNLPKKESVNTAIANNIKGSAVLNNIAKQKISKQNQSELAGVERYKETNNASPSPSNNDNVRQDLYYECHVCDVKVPNNNLNIIDHIKGKRHEQNVIKLKPAYKINKEGLSDIPEDSSKENGLVKNNLQANVEGSSIGIKRSKEKRKITNERENDSADITSEVTTIPSISQIEKTNGGGKDENETISNVANNDFKTIITVETNSSNVYTNYSTDHLNTGNNIDTYNAKTSDDNKSKTEKSEEKTENEGFYICSICNQIIPDNATDIQIHLNSYRHKVKEAEKREKEKEGLLPTDVHFCNICKKQVSKDPISIKNHNDCVVHKREFERVLSENRIKIKDDKICFCQACDLYFSKFSVSSHIGKAKHLVKLSEN